MLESLFFELIKVAIGNQDCLSRLPLANEWDKLFAMAKKQSLVGITFIGLQKLGANAEDGFATIGMSEDLYFTWVGVAAKINVKNELVNRQCAVVQQKLEESGKKCCILKGQGIGSLYQDLALYRQSGDIDVWIDGGFHKGLALARILCGDVNYDYINAHLTAFDETEVELHWRVQALTNLFRNRKLQKWVSENEGELLNTNCKLASGEIIHTPSVRFNAFYILLHCYHHMFESGLGLRQVMDYYFVLQQPLSAKDKQWAVDAIQQFGMMKFARGLMNVMHVAFGLPEERMLVEQDAKEGAFLLKEIMQNGNFGHHDERVKKVSDNKRIRFMTTSLQHNWHLASHYPGELLWSPIWLIWHYVWKRTNRI